MMVRSRPEFAGSALNLAVFRITIALVLLGSVDVWSAQRWAALPSQARVVPPGLAFIVAELPISTLSVRLAQLALGVAAVLGLVGLFSRTAFAFAALAAFYVLGVPQLSGAVLHDHHLVWFSLVLAASPCGDALSVDAWLARRRGRQTQPRLLACGVALWTVWLLIAGIFFFPGYCKLREAGIAWIDSDNLRNLLHWKWMQMGSIPALRIDRFPLFCRVLAGAVVLFELTFPLLIVNRRLRWIALGSAMTFHLATHYFMGLNFAALWLCYTALVDWRPLVLRIRSRFATAAQPVQDFERRRDVVLAAFIGGALLVANAVYGLGCQSIAWPFACYPTFAQLAPDAMPGIEVELVRQKDDIEVLPRAALYDEPNSSRAWGLEFSLAGASHPSDEARLRAWWDQAQKRPGVAHRLRGAGMVRVYAVARWVDPDRWKEAPRRTHLLLETTPSTSP